MQVDLLPFELLVEVLFFYFLNYQQLHAADMMGFKSEATLVKYRKNGVLKENIHWIRTLGRGISYKPQACKLAIQKAKNEKQRL